MFRLAFGEYVCLLLIFTNIFCENAANQASKALLADVAKQLLPGYDVSGGAYVINDTARITQLRTHAQRV